MLRYAAFIKDILSDWLVVPLAQPANESANRVVYRLHANVNTATVITPRTVPSSTGAAITTSIRLSFRPATEAVCDPEIPYMIPSEEPNSPYMVVKDLGFLCLHLPHDLHKLLQILSIPLILGLEKKPRNPPNPFNLSILPCLLVNHITNILRQPLLHHRSLNLRRYRRLFNTSGREISISRSWYASSSFSTSSP